MSSHLRRLRGQVDPVLTNLAVGYKNAEFIAEKIFPQVFTDKEGVQVPVFGKGSFVEYDTKRAVGVASNVIGCAELSADCVGRTRFSGWCGLP